MGRSQVQRNRARGRPGGGRGTGQGETVGRGRGSGRGGSGRSSGSGGGQHDLGDNAFRFERGANAKDDEELDDLLLDDAQLLSSGFGDYYGPSHHEASSTLSSRGKSGDDFLLSNDDPISDEGCWNIDTAALAKCLSHIPLAERIDVPWHVGDRLEKMYYGSESRKLTLAELREEAKVASNVGGGQVEKGPQHHKDVSAVKRGDVALKSNATKEDQAVAETAKINSDAEKKSVEDTSGDKDDEDDDEDLDAWLDDMIS